MSKHYRIPCLVDHQLVDATTSLTLAELDPQIQATILADYPQATGQDFICNEHLMHYRLAKLDDLMAKDQQANRKLSHRLTQVFKQDDYQVIDVNQQLEQSLTFGHRIADAVARFGGSWPFIILFVTIMLAWMIINVIPIFSHHFDPYPFILLNLFLSMVAAIQAPLIMMSQKRRPITTAYKLKMIFG